MDQETPEDTFNYGLVTFKLTDGTVAYYEAGWGGSIAADNTKEFIGPKGRITITEKDNRVDSREEGDLITVYNKETKEYEHINVNCVRRPTMTQLNYLIDMIENDAPAFPPIDEVLTGMETVLAADKLLKKNK